MKIVQTIRRTVLQILIDFILVYITSEKHIEYFKDRKDITELLKSSGELGNLLQRLMHKGLQLMESSVRFKPDDRHRMYDILFTAHIGGLLRDQKSQEMTWFKENFQDTEKCVAFTWCWCV